MLSQKQVVECHRLLHILGVEGKESSEVFFQMIADALNTRWHYKARLQALRAQLSDFRKDYNTALLAVEKAEEDLQHYRGGEDVHVVTKRLFSEVNAAFGSKPRAKRENFVEEVNEYRQSLGLSVVTNSSEYVRWREREVWLHKKSYRLAMLVSRHGHLTGAGEDESYHPINRPYELQYDFVRSKKRGTIRIGNKKINLEIISKINVLEHECRGRVNAYHEFPDYVPDDSLKASQLQPTAISTSSAKDEIIYNQILLSRLKAHREAMKKGANGSDDLRPDPRAVEDSFVSILFETLAFFLRGKSFLLRSEELTITAYLYPYVNGAPSAAYHRTSSFNHIKVDFLLMRDFLDAYLANRERIPENNDYYGVLAHEFTHAFELHNRRYFEESEIQELVSQLLSEEASHDTLQLMKLLLTTKTEGPETAIDFFHSPFSQTKSEVIFFPGFYFPDFRRDKKKLYMKFLHGDYGLSSKESKQEFSRADESLSYAVGMYLFLLFTLYQLHTSGEIYEATAVVQRGAIPEMKRKIPLTDLKMYFESSTTEKSPVYFKMNRRDLPKLDEAGKKFALMRIEDIFRRYGQITSDLSLDLSEDPLLSPNYAHVDSQFCRLLVALQKKSKEKNWRIKQLLHKGFGRYWNRSRQVNQQE